MNQLAMSKNQFVSFCLNNQLLTKRSIISYIGGEKRLTMLMNFIKANTGDIIKTWDSRSHKLSQAYRHFYSLVESAAPSAFIGLLFTILDNMSSELYVDYTTKITIGIFNSLISSTKHKPRTIQHPLRRCYSFKNYIKQNDDPDSFHFNDDSNISIY
jgi:hypothetical protein